MEPFIKDLMSADDLSITQNEFSSTENLSNLCEYMEL